MEHSTSEALPLLAEVAHDMRSPLSAILILVERLREGDSGPVTRMQERHLALIYSAAFGLSGMADDLLELGRAENTLANEIPTAFSMAELLRSVRDLVQPVAEEKGLLLRLSGPVLDVRIGHEGAINRVLLNLTSNALKYTDTGWVSVLVEPVGEHRLAFAVEDSGRGMPASELERFANAPADSTGLPAGRFSSSGLGLAICRKLVTAMGGILHAETLATGGTRFSFALDLPLSKRP